VIARVAELIRIQLDDYNAISGVYPANQNDFEDVINGIVSAGGGGLLNLIPVWFLSNDRSSVSNYAPISNDSVSVDFASYNFTYTLNFAVSSRSKAGSAC
jgi:hypothetical protein